MKKAIIIKGSFYVAVESQSTHVHFMSNHLSLLLKTSSDPDPDKDSVCDGIANFTWSSSGLIGKAESGIVCLAGSNLTASTYIVPRILDPTAAAPV